METGDAADASRAPKLECWVDENPGGMFPKIQCCLILETLPTDPGPGMSHMDNPDTTLPSTYCTSKRVPSMPEINDGSIVLRVKGGQEYCLRSNGSYGVCATESSLVDRGIKEKGIR